MNENFHSGIGWIPYWNLLPLKTELQRLCPDIRIKNGHPSEVNSWLRSGEVWLSPSSSVNLLKSADLYVALPLGVASVGCVDSVYLGCRDGSGSLANLVRVLHAKAVAKVKSFTTHEEANNFLLQCVSQSISKQETLPIVSSKASEASNALAQILHRVWISQLSTDDIDRDISESLEVVIGDEALVRRPEFGSVFDLGMAWYELTGLPFVFAVWQCNSKYSSMNKQESLTSALLHAARACETKMRTMPSIYSDAVHAKDNFGCDIDLPNYWSKIFYLLEREHFQGLKLFLLLYSELNSNKDLINFSFEERLTLIK